MDSFIGGGSHDPAHTDAMGGTPMIQPLAITERVAIEQAINVCGGNIPRAAALLDISPLTYIWVKTGQDSHIIKAITGSRNTTRPNRSTITLPLPDRRP